jgi:predicted dithiol-disulfide oxidoreductase (DUF899 family)
VEPKSNPAEDLLAIQLAELGLHFQRQYKYAKGRRFKADFAVWYCAPQYWDLETSLEYDYRLALIEIQGGIFTRQAHSSITGILKDNERLYEACRAEWSVLRFTPQQVNSGRAKEMLKDLL